MPSLGCSALRQASIVLARTPAAIECATGCPTQTGMDHRRIEFRHPVHQ